MNGRTNTVSGSPIYGTLISLEAPTNLVLTPLNARVDIAWTDPVDKVASPGGEDVAVWAKTIIVRKEGSAPTSPTDGVLVYTETTRNQHQYDPYSDTMNIVNNTEYYYVIFAISQLGSISEPTIGTCTPYSGIPVFDKIDITLEGYDRHIWMSTTANDNVIFAGGDHGIKNTSSSFITDIAESINSLLVYQKIDNLSKSIRGGAGCCSTGNRAWFAGGIYNVNGAITYSTDVITTYDDRLVKTSPASLTKSRTGIGGSTVADYAIFAGGISQPAGSILNTVDVYNSDLVRSSAQELPIGGTIIAATYTKSHALFAGITQSYDKNFPDVTAYDSDMTYQSIDQLSEFRYALSAGSIDGYAMFCGGYDYTLSPNVRNTVDVYSPSLTKIGGIAELPQQNITNLSSTPLSGNIGSFIMISYHAYDSNNKYCTSFVKYDGSLTQSYVDTAELRTNRSYAMSGNGKYAFITLNRQGGEFTNMLEIFKAI